MIVYLLVKPSQDSFVRGMSCITNLLEFLEKATESVDIGEASNIVCLDFAKAFGKLPQRKLLEARRITGNVLK